MPAIPLPTIRPTRIPALGYRQDGPALWRFYDISDSTRAAAVGPQYKTKAEMLADLDSYAQEAGWTPRAAPVRLQTAPDDIAGLYLDRAMALWDLLSAVDAFAYDICGKLDLAQIPSAQRLRAARDKARAIIAP